ncbi:MAG TPA: flagellar biosynthesis protein FlhA [Terracidiphilus sp.]|jgi:flagellar biosynthesis protein FlhA
MSTATHGAGTLPQKSSILQSLRDYLLPMAAISVIFVMLVPVPAAVLDLLLAISMACSIIVFLSAVQIRRAVELSVFPTLLLLLTLFRLSLNIASTRRILLHGQEGTAAAGKVIEAFGQFVVGGNYVVGFVLFLALVAIQFLVVAHGAVRTAEVTARFTLDALPGKQMAIDADMNAGLIDEAEARRRRQAIAREAEFYGAMDGAARFNQRDALATILITAINIVAGLLIGTLQQGIELGEAARTYTVLTVGDGLVTIIPSLLVSVAGGITLTRANSAGMLGGEIRQQLLARPATLYMASAVSACMCLIPGLPKFAFLAVAATLYMGGRRISSAAPATIPAELAAGEKKKAENAQGSDLAAMMRLEELTLEIGFQLIPLVDEKQGGQLLGRVRSLRRHLSSEMGFLVPPVHISDNLRLKPREYVVSLRGIEIGRWQTESPHLLAVSSEPGRRPLAGKETREPAFGVPAIWIAPALEDAAIAAGYSVVDSVTVITTHLGELVRQHAAELVGRAEVKRLLDALNDSHPKLLEELVPKLLTLGEVARVLEQLLRERVSICDLGPILEAMLETAPATKNLVALVESSRAALGRRLVQPLLDGDGQLPVLLLDPALEEEILSTVSPEGSALGGGPRLLATGARPATPVVRRLADSVRSLIGSASSSAPPVLLCPSPARYFVRRWLEPVLPRLAVVAASEVPPEIRLRPVGTVR